MIGIGSTRLWRGQDMMVLQQVYAERRRHYVVSPLDAKGHPKGPTEMVLEADLLRPTVTVDVKEVQYEW